MHFPSISLQDFLKSAVFVCGIHIWRRPLYSCGIHILRNYFAGALSEFSFTWKSTLVYCCLNLLVWISFKTHVQFLTISIVASNHLFCLLMNLYSSYNLLYWGPSLAWEELLQWMSIALIAHFNMCHCAYTCRVLTVINLIDFYSGHQLLLSSGPPSFQAPFDSIIWSRKDQFF